MLARSFAVFLRQPGQAALAASMARLVSSAPRLGMVPSTSLVAGLLTSTLLPESALHQAPSMTHCWRNSLGSWRVSGAPATARSCMTSLASTGTDRRWDGGD